MRVNRWYVYLKKIRFWITAFLGAAIMTIPAYGQYGGSAETAENSFSIKSSGYSVVFILNGASWVQGYVPPAEYETGEGMILPGKSELAYTGFCFSGWFKNADCSGEPVERIYPGESGDRVLYAGWKCEHSQGTEVSYDSKNHWFYCRLCKEITESGEHSCSAVLIQEPTCVLNGVHRYSCRCGYQYDSPDVAALGHAWKNNLDYNEAYHARLCSRCAAETEKAGHSLLWQENGIQCWQECTGCGYTQNPHSISLLYHIGTMAASDWWSQSHQIRVESRNVSISPGTMLLVSSDYRVDRSPFMFNIDFYPDEAGCETHLFGQTYRQHINWWTGAMPGYAVQFRLFDNLNTSCSSANRAILENCRIYKIGTASALALPAEERLCTKEEEGMSTPSQADRRTPSQTKRRTSSQADRRTSSQADRRTSSQADRNLLLQQNR